MTQRSEKETALFDAVLSLIQSGQSLYQIKVSDIAERAGIGKGTVYGYFKSKEELLTQALWYLVDCELDSATQAVHAAGTFEGMLSSLMDVVYGCMRSRFSIMRMLLTQNGGHDLQSYLQGQQAHMQQVGERLQALIAHCLAIGVQEGVIAPQPPAYAMPAFFSLLSSMNFLTCKPPFCRGNEIDLPAAKRICYTLLCESLKTSHFDVVQA